MGGMSKHTLIIATGHVDKHNCILTEDALQEMADQLNGEYKGRVGVEHDQTVPPLGWLDSAHTAPHEGTIAVYATARRFDARRAVELPDGSQAIEEYSTDSTFRFVLHDGRRTEDVLVETDPVGFADFSEQEAFEASLPKPDDLDVRTSGYMRKALINDPEVIISLAQTLGIVYLLSVGAKGFAESFGQEMGKDAAKQLTSLLSFLRDAIVNFHSRMTDHGKPVTYIVRIDGDPQIELVARSDDADVICKAFCDPSFGGLYDYTVKLNEAFNVDAVQFLLSDDGRWKFNYLLTKSGTAIGTKAAYDRRTVLLNNLGRE